MSWIDQLARHLLSRVNFFMRPGARAMAGHEPFYFHFTLRRP